MISLNSPEFKVGVLVVVVSALIGTMSLMVAEGPSPFARSKDYFIDIKDASGLVKNSAVRMAGIKVGTIRDIELQDGMARIYLEVENDVPLYSSGRAEIRADGILGDKHVALISGDPNDPPLKSGSAISAVGQSGSMDQILSEVSKITGSLGKLSESLNKAIQGEGDPSTPLGRIVLNVENLTKDLAEVSGRNKEKLNEIIDRVQNISRAIDQFFNDESPDSFQAGWHKAAASLHRIDKSLKNIEEITDKVNRGEGTLGRLVNDEETIDGINTAVEKVNDFLGGASELETSFDFHSEYLADVDLTKSYLSVKIQPGLDRYYELGVVDDPRGVTETEITDRTTTPGGDVSIEEVKTYKNKVKFTALFAKNFYDLTLKAGLIESSGGVALDYHLLNRSIRLSMEAFNFRNPYVRAYARYNVLKGIYLIGGGDNIFSDDDEYSTFFGAGIFLTNDDLKLLATKFTF